MVPESVDYTLICERVEKVKHLKANGRLYGLGLGLGLRARVRRRAVVGRGSKGPAAAGGTALVANAKRGRG